MINSEVEKIISLARDKYTVHECRECTYRKCCDLNINGFGSAECLSRRVSISLMLGIEDSCFTKLLDDIEAALKREREAVEADALAVGGVVEAARHKPCNAAAIREVLKYIVSLLRSDTFVVLNPPAVEIISKILLASEAALSAPARQCDVGTADEQAERFRNLCNKYYDDENPCNKDCPLASLDIIHGFPRCQAYWSQTPYAAEEGAGK